MKSVEDLAKEIVIREGGFVNDPDDPGGATKHGVTIGTLRRLGLDLDNDGDVDIDDVKRISTDFAVEIYTKEYFTKPKLDMLPAVIQASVFDMYVNAGNNAIKILQRLLIQMGRTVTVDGVIGPQTIHESLAAYQSAPEHFADAYGIARRNYYFSIADSRPTSRKYAITKAGGKGGWISRAEEFISPKYHMTDEEFKRRTAKWVS